MVARRRIQACPSDAGDAGSTPSTRAPSPCRGPASLAIHSGLLLLRSPRSGPIRLWVEPVRSAKCTGEAAAAIEADRARHLVNGEGLCLQQFSGVAHADLAQREHRWLAKSVLEA